MEAKTQQGMLRLHEVCALVGVSKQSIYTWVHNGAFPPPLQLGSRAIGWRAAEINEWLSTREVVPWTGQQPA